MVESTKKAKTRKLSKPAHTNLSNKSVDIRAVPHKKKFPYEFTTD